MPDLLDILTGAMYVFSERMKKNIYIVHSNSRDIMLNSKFLMFLTEYSEYMVCLNENIFLLIIDTQNY